jgi:hypothetical protein
VIADRIADLGRKGSWPDILADLDSLTGEGRAALAASLKDRNRGSSASKGWARAVLRTSCGARQLCPNDLTPAC